MPENEFPLTMSCSLLHTHSSLCDTQTRVGRKSRIIHCCLFFMKEAVIQGGRVPQLLGMLVDATKGAECDHQSIYGSEAACWWGWGKKITKGFDQAERPQIAPNTFAPQQQMNKTILHSALCKSEIHTLVSLFAKIIWVMFNFEEINHTSDCQKISAIKSSRSPVTLTCLSLTVTTKLWQLFFCIETSLHAKNHCCQGIYFAVWRRVFTLEL